PSYLLLRYVCYEFKARYLASIILIHVYVAYLAYQPALFGEYLCSLYPDVFLQELDRRRYLADIRYNIFILYCQSVFADSQYIFCCYHPGTEYLYPAVDNNIVNGSLLSVYYYALDLSDLHAVGYADDRQSKYFLSLLHLKIPSLIL